MIVGSAAHIPEELRPHFYQVIVTKSSYNTTFHNRMIIFLLKKFYSFKIYSNNEALTPNPRSPLEDYSLHLVDLRGGKLCDTRHFKVDKIYLSHNQGIIYNNISTDILRLSRCYYPTELDQSS